MIDYVFNYIENKTVAENPHPAEQIHSVHVFKSRRVKWYTKLFYLGKKIDSNLKNFKNRINPRLSFEKQ